MKPSNPLCIALIALALFAASSCDPFNESNDDTHTTGSLSLTVNLDKTILPNFEIASFTLSGTGPSDQSFSRGFTLAELPLSVTNLAAGTWTLEFKGLNTDGQTICQGTTSTTVLADQTAEASIDCAFLQSATGSVSVNLGWPAETVVDSATATLDDTVLSLDLQDQSITYSDPALDSGAHMLVFKLYQGSFCVCTVMESLLVYDYQTSQKTISLASTDFASAPTAPENLAVVKRNGALLLTWSDTSNTEISYQVERKDSDSATWTALGTVIANTVSYSDTSVTSGTTYTYRVRACNDFGYSSYTAEVPITCLFPVITSVTAAPGNYSLYQNLYLTLTSNSSGYTAKTLSINGSDCYMSDNQDGTYTVRYYLTSSFTERYGAETIPVSIIIQDSFGNVSAEFTGPITSTGAVNLDRTSPWATLSLEDHEVSDKAIIAGTLVFNEEVTGLDESDFVLTNASISDLYSPDGIQWTFKLRPSAEDLAASIDLPAEAVVDRAGKGNQDITAVSVTYDKDLNLGSVRRITPSNDPLYVYAMDYDRRYIYRVNTSTHEVSKEVRLPYDYPVDMDFSPESNTLYVVFENNGIMASYNLDSKTLTETAYSSSLTGRGIKVADSLDRIYILSPNTSVSYYSDLTVLSRSTLNSCGYTKFLQGNLMAVDPLGEKFYLLTLGQAPAYIRRYSVTGDVAVLEESNDAGSYARSLTLSHNGTRLLAFAPGGNGDPSCTVYDYEAQNLANAWGDWDLEGGPVTGIFNTSDSILYACNFEDDYLYVMDTENYQCIRKLTFPNADTGVLSLNSDESVLVGYSCNSIDSDEKKFSFFTDLQGSVSLPSSTRGIISDMTGVSQADAVFAVDQSNQTLVKLDTANQTVSSLIKLPQTDPLSMDYSAVDNKLYIASRFSGDITVYDIGSDTFSSLHFSDTLDGRIVRVAPSLRRIYISTAISSYSCSFIIMDMDSGAILSTNRLTSYSRVNFDIDETDKKLILFIDSKIYRYDIQNDSLGSSEASVSASLDFKLLNGGATLVYSYETSLYACPSTDFANPSTTLTLSFEPTAMAVSSDETMLYYSGSYLGSGMAGVVDLSNKTELRTFPFTNCEDYTRMCIGKNGSSLVGFSYDSYYKENYSFYFFTDISQ